MPEDYPVTSEASDLLDVGRGIVSQLILRLFYEACQVWRITRVSVAKEFAETILTVPENERRGPFFTVLTKEGRPYSRKRHQVGKIIAELGRKAVIVVKAHQQTGEKEFAFAHDLRRSFGERWAKRVEAPFFQKMMRHSAITTTLRYYSSRDADAAHIDQAFHRSQPALVTQGDN